MLARLNLGLPTAGVLCLMYYIFTCAYLCICVRVICEYIYSPEAPHGGVLAEQLLVCYAFCTCVYLWVFYILCVINCVRVLCE